MLSKTTHKIINGDSRQMSELKDKSVHLTTFPEEYFSVKEIINPKLLKLNNDLIIRLIGIKQNPKINGQATEYLKDKLHGKKVFLKYDERKHDSDNHLMVYLYLENKTFVNAHLLKEGMADVDESVEFKYKSEFLIFQ